MTRKEYEAYHRGFIHGLRCFAHWKDGNEFVGTTGTILLKEAEAVAETQWSFAPTDSKAVNIRLKEDYDK